MIKYIHGDLLNSPAQVLVNTVNTDGVMGKGIALQFKKKYPDMFKKYQIFCENKMLSVGKLWIYNAGTKWILNFPTKQHWRNKSQYEYIEEGLKKFVETYQEKGITSIAFPKLGCGNGGLDWEIVKKMMEQYMKNLPIDIYIYEEEYKDIKEYEETRGIKKWLHTEVKNLPYAEFKEDLKELISNSDLLNQEHIDYELEDLWNKLRNGEFYCLDVMWLDNEFGKEIISTLHKLDYIVNCKVFNAIKGVYVDAVQIYDISEEKMNKGELL
ncbi:macro domain-containing protein [Amedibacillus sp. YH-ame10]